MSCRARAVTALHSGRIHVARMPTAGDVLAIMDLFFATDIVLT
jgi:hypothetical protein